MKVARKFTLALVAGILVVHAGAAAYRIDRERRLFEQDNARDARVLGRVLGHAVEQTWLAHGQREALQLVEHATARETHIDIRWVWANATPGDPHAPVLSDATLAPLSDGNPVVTTRDDDEGGVLYTYVPVPIPGQPLGAIEVADPLGEEHRYMMRSLTNTLVTTSLLVLLCAALTWLLGVQLIAEPVRRIVEQARAIGRGELGHRLRPTVRDELGELAEEIDHMCDRLQEARDTVEEETNSRLRAVEQLRHADRLKTVGTMASGLAHELGTPINVIDGHAALLREDPEATDAVKESAEVVSRQCRRMATIIRNLLDFARRGNPRATTCDATEAVRQTLKMVAPLARKQDVEVVCDDATGSAEVAVAFDQLQQVVANLVVNALHAMPTGGTLSVGVEVKSARRNGGEPSDHVVVTVTDTGIGMDADTLERVFEPFFTTKDVGEGTGLGLSVAYGIAEDHDGWLDVQSSPGKGSTFTLYLPREVPDAA